LVRLYKVLGGGWTSMTPDEKEIALKMEKRNEIED
jgi:hypothetical protein